MRSARVPCVAVGASNADGVVTTALVLCVFSSMTDALQFVKHVHMHPNEIECPFCYTNMCYSRRSNSTDSCGLVTRLSMGVDAVPAAALATHPGLLAAI